MSRGKGNRNERHARDRLKEDGFRVHKTAGGTFDNDAWDVADLIALRDDKVLLVQVKTNGFAGITQYKQQMKVLQNYMPDNCVFEIWSRYDGRPGPHTCSPAWRKKRWDDETESFDEIHDGRAPAQIG